MSKYACRSLPQFLSLLVAALILIAAMFGPKRDVGDCIRSVPVGAGATLSLNCDSRHITGDAQKIERYLTSFSPSRTRPVHIISVGALTHILSPAIVPFSGQIAKLVPGVRPSQMPFYLGGVVFNMGVVAAAIFAMWLVCGTGKERFLAVAIAAFVASYDVTVAWFWVPHQILMNLLVPVGTVFLFMAGRGASYLPLTSVIGLGLATAFAALTYGYCLVWPIAFEVGLMFGAAQIQGRKGGIAVDVLLPATAYGAAFCLPLVIWL